MVARPDRTVNRIGLGKFGDYAGNSLDQFGEIDAGRHESVVHVQPVPGPEVEPELPGVSVGMGMRSPSYSMWPSPVPAISR
jgi:hypothetical protein